MLFKTVFVGLRRPVILASSSTRISTLGMSSATLLRAKSTMIMSPAPRKAASKVETAIQLGSAVKTRSKVETKAATKTSSAVKTKSVVKPDSVVKSKSVIKTSTTMKTASTAKTASAVKTKSAAKSKPAAKAKPGAKAIAKIPDVVLPKPTLQKVECWIDSATSTGLVAVVVGTNYKVFRLKEGWKKAGRDINWAETIGFELVARVLVAQGFTGIATVYCDSTTALNAFGGGKCRVQSIKECTTRLQAERGTLPFMIEAIHVSGKKNLADGFSRGRTAEGFQELGGIIAIPEALETFLHAA